MSDNIHLALSCRIISAFVGVKKFFQSLYIDLHFVFNKLINYTIHWYFTYFLFTLIE